jgi:hypothetical protein
MSRISRTDTLAALDTLVVPEAHAFRKWNVERLRPYAFISIAYIVVSFLTRPIFQGDTTDYVDSIVAHNGGTYLEFWDFGHLLWRPTGWLVFRVLSPVLSRIVGSDQRIQVVVVLTLLSWLAGLASAFFLLAFFRSMGLQGWISCLIITTFISSFAVLNYSHAGCLYIPGLCFIVIAMYFMARGLNHPGENIGFAVCAGLALASSVSFWFLYILALPAAMAFPFALEASRKTRFRYSFVTFSFFCLGTVSIYFAILAHLGLLNVAGALSWMLASSHGITISGVSRAVFGWPRSFISMGEAGRTIKRYLLHDPFNPISGRDLLQLWPEIMKFALFYVTVFLVIVGLGHSSRGRTLLAWAAVAALPVLAFAIHWSGGDLERYLPLYPAFFLALTILLADQKTPKWMKAITWIFVSCIVLTNTVDLRSAVAESSQARAENRLNALVPRLKEGSLVIVSHNLDDLMAFHDNFPFNPINRQDALSLYPLLTPGNSDIVTWKERFAFRVLGVWNTGGDIWISNRLLQRVPQANWNWVERDDNRVSWSEFSPFFTQLQYGESVNGSDGFILLLSSAENQNILKVIGAKRFN